MFFLDLFMYTFLFIFRCKELFQFFVSFFKYEIGDEINNKIKINIAEVKSKIIDEAWFVEKVSSFFIKIIFFCHQVFFEWFYIF